MVCFMEISILIFRIYTSPLWNIQTKMNQVIIREIRLPRILMAIISGSALSIAGMLMQTLFQNPLAGPYVLGINSGSSLMVALGLLSGIGIFNSELGLIGSALVGAFIFGLFILFTASFLRNQIGLLLFGVMLGSFVSSIITILEVGSHAESLKAFSLWSMGSLNGVSIQQLPIICIVFIFTCFLTIFIVKPLNILVLGEEEVRLMGYDVKIANTGRFCYCCFYRFDYGLLWSDSFCRACCS